MSNDVIRHLLTKEPSEAAEKYRIEVRQRQDKLRAAKKQRAQMVKTAKALEAQNILMNSLEWPKKKRDSK